METGAMEKLIATAQDAVAIDVTEIPGNDEVVLVNARQDYYTLLRIPPPRRRHKVLTLSSLERAYEMWGIKGTIWVGCDKITLACDTDDRRDTVEMRLEKTNEFACLEALATDKMRDTFEQRQVIRFLRVTMRDCLEDIDALCATFRRIDFSVLSTRSGEVAKGKDSLGKSVDAVVSNAEQLPDMLIARPRVYESPDIAYRHSVRILVDVDPQQGVFRLTPIMRDLVEAQHGALDWVSDTLSESSSATVLLGEM